METFTMSRKEAPRAGLVRAALDGRITNAQGASALGMSVRQFQRLKRRFEGDGVRSLTHRTRGRPSPRRLPPEVQARIVALMTATYGPINDVHLTEKLQELHALPVSRATVRRVRVALGRPAHRRRRAPTHRRRRPRAPALGQLAQIDASPHAWFEARGPAAALHGFIDDASSTPLALWFCPTEDLHGYTTVLAATCRQYGVPVTLYGDRLNVLQRNDRHWSLEEQLRGQQEPTHFGRMLADLGIGFIRARSPQAKGRIERLWQTLQDRLVTELRLRDLSTIAAANAFLPDFLTDFIRRFALPPAHATPAWRPVPRDLDRILSCRYARIVARDNTVHIGPRWIQIPPGPGGRAYAGCHVEVRELLDGRGLVLYDDVLIATQGPPDGAFVLKPRAAPSAARRRPTMPTSSAPALRRALAALGRPARPGARAPMPAALPPPPAATSAAMADPVADVPPPAASRPAPTHPWRRAFSRRGRERQTRPGG